MLQVAIERILCCATNQAFPFASYANLLLIVCWCALKDSLTVVKQSGFPEIRPAECIIKPQITVPASAEHISIFSRPVCCLLSTTPTLEQRHAWGPLECVIVTPADWLNLNQQIVSPPPPPAESLTQTHTGLAPLLIFCLFTEGHRCVLAGSWLILAFF